MNMSDYGYYPVNVPTGFGIDSVPPEKIRDDLDPERDIIIENGYHHDSNLVFKVEEAFKRAGFVKRFGAGYISQEKTKDQLLGWNPWNPNDKKMPSRLDFEDALRSHIWAKCYNIGVHENWWAFWEPLIPERQSNIHVACSVVTWEFGDSFASSIVAKLVAQSGWSPAANAYVIKYDWYERYKRSLSYFRTLYYSR